MVQKDTRRRSSLILGILLALLLGAAAGFFVLAVPIRMLESVTTFTRLSTLMVQAEPPISPSDRTLLAVLAGILTAGIGWVLVDWLLFGRAGMSTIIKPREDDYEDEDGDSFRPTDPLDLVSPVAAPTQDWAPPSMGDARRPLSARTDIGDPPAPASPFGVAPLPQPGIEPPNPFGQIPPGVGTAAPPLQPVVPPPLLQPQGVPPLPVAPALGGTTAAGIGSSGDEGGVGASLPPLDLTTPQPSPQPHIAPPAMPMAQPVPPAAQMGQPVLPAGTGWLPVPGARPDGGQPSFEPTDAMADQPLPTSDTPTSQPMPVMPQPVAAPIQPAPPPIAFEPPAPVADIPASRPAMTPPYTPPISIAPPDAAATPVTPPPFAPAAIEPAAPAAPAAPPRVARSGSLPEPSFDKARLEELLARLERGLQARRAAAAAAPATRAAPAAPAPAPAPAAPVTPPPPPVAHPGPMRIEQPGGQAPIIPSALPPFEMPAAPAQLLGFPPVAAPPIDALTPAPAFAPAMAGGAAASDDVSGRNDALLDQPLHVTLDLLRGMVKR